MPLEISLGFFFSNFYPRNIPAALPNSSREISQVKFPWIILKLIWGWTPPNTTPIMSSSDNSLTFFQVLHCMFFREILQDSSKDSFHLFFNNYLSTLSRKSSKFSPRVLELFRWYFCLFFCPRLLYRSCRYPWRDSSEISTELWDFFIIPYMPSYPYRSSQGWLEFRLETFHGI